MARLDFQVEIAAPADRVFAFFIPQRMVLWYGPEMEIQLEVQGGAAEFGLGQKVRIAGRLGRREVSLVAVVTRYERLRTLEWRFHDAHGVRGRQTWELEPSPASVDPVRDIGPAQPVIPNRRGPAQAGDPSTALRARRAGRAGRGEKSVGSQADSRTRVRMNDEYDLPGRMGWVADALLVRWSVRHRDRRWLANLRRLAERRGD